MNQLLSGYKKQDKNYYPHEINVNVVVNLQQSNVNLQMSIDSDIPFNVFVNGIKEQVFPQRMHANYEETIEYQLGNGSKIQQNESRTLQNLGFTNNCTLYMRLKLQDSQSYSYQLYKQNYEPNPVIIVNVSVHYQHTEQNLKLDINPEIPFNIFVNRIKEQIFDYQMQAKYEKTIEWQLGDGSLLYENNERTLQNLGFKNNCTLYVRLRLKVSAPNFKQVEKKKYKVLVDLQSETKELFIEQFETNPISFIFHDILIELFNNQQLKIDHPFAFFINEKEIEPFDIRQIKDFETNNKVGIILKTILSDKEPKKYSIEKYKVALNSSKQIKPNLKKMITIQYNNDMEIHVKSDNNLEEILNIICEDLKNPQINLDQSKIYKVNDIELSKLNNVYPINNIKVYFQNKTKIIVFQIIGDFYIKVNLRVTIIDKGQVYFYQIDELKSMNTSMEEFLQYLKFKIFGSNKINYRQDIIDQRDDMVEILYRQN